jgi:hypothetical protein
MARRKLKDELYDLADELRSTKIEGSFFTRIWMGAGLNHAAEIIESRAAELIVDEIVDRTQRSEEEMLHGKTK